MNLHQGIAARVAVAGLGVALFGSLLVACATGQGFRSAGEPTPTSGAAVGAPVPANAGAPVSGARSTGASSAAVAAPAAPAIAAAGAAAVSQAMPAIATPAPSTVKGIVVSGTGRVSARPDRATVSAGVQTRGRTAQEAQNDNNQTMQAVIAAIKAVGIPDQSIRTNGVSLYPIYDQGQVITGYNASNNVVVTVDDVNQVGTVLDAAVRAGANQATNVQFGFKDESALRNKALAAAAADARAKADALAGALGLQITGIESVAEGGVSTPIVTQPRALGVSAAAPASAPIEPGQLDVVAQVTVVFGY
jgi:uncharacterized protein YggE